MTTTPITSNTATIPATTANPKKPLGRFGLTGILFSGVGGIDRGGVGVVSEVPGMELLIGFERAGGIIS